MAFSSGKVSTESGEIKRYIGIAPVKILCVNPTKATIADIYQTPQEKDPEYTGVTKVGEDQHEVPYARIDFFVQTDAEKCDGIDMITRVSFFIRKERRFNSNKEKVQVIDKYGRTAWVTAEQAKKKEVPVYANGPANIDPDYRPVYQGEEDLTKFLITYLNIPSVMEYNRDTKEWKMKEDTSQSEARLERIEDYFKGDFSEINNTINLQPQNKLRVLFGVRTTDDNRQFQDVYTRMFLRNNATNWDKLELDVAASKNAGAYAHTEFECCPLKEYVLQPTPITAAPQAAADDPWDFG